MSRMRSPARSARRLPNASRRCCRVADLTVHEPPEVESLGVAAPRLATPAALAGLCSDVIDRAAHAHGKAVRDVVRNLHGDLKNAGVHREVGHLVAGHHPALGNAWSEFVPFLDSTWRSAAVRAFYTYSYQRGQCWRWCRCVGCGSWRVGGGDREFGLVDSRGAMAVTGWFMPGRRDI